MIEYKQGTYQGKTDTEPYQQAPWNGDKAAWEKAMTQRNQAQNEYKRVQLNADPTMRVFVDRASRRLAACGMPVCPCAAAAADRRRSHRRRRRRPQRQQTQPLNNAPVWREVRSGAPQVSTVVGRETNVLIQPQGQTWRALRNGASPCTVAGRW